MEKLPTLSDELESLKLQVERAELVLQTYSEKAGRWKDTSLSFFRDSVKNKGKAPR